MKNLLVWSMGIYPSIKSWLAVQMKRLKLIQDNQMAENVDSRHFWTKPRQTGAQKP